MTFLPPFPQWRVESELVEYPHAVKQMESHVTAMVAGQEMERLWLVEHPPLYTAGTSANNADLLMKDQFPVYQAGRGGQFTYHGPGQRVIYTMLDLKKRMNGAPDIRRFVWLLEEWMIRTLAQFEVHAERRDGRVGIWVVRDDGREEKIGAIGIRVRKWVSFHGVALNVNPDLTHFSGIVPCGISEHGVTSLHALGHHVAMSDVDNAFKSHFQQLDWSCSA